MTFRFRLCTCAIIALLSATAHADLIGDTVVLEVQEDYDGAGEYTADPMNPTVSDSAVESLLVLVVPGGRIDRWDIDIGAESIRLQWRNTNQKEAFPSGIEFTLTVSDLDWLSPSGGEIPGKIDGFSITTFGAVTFGESNVTFTDDSVTIDFAGTVWAGRQFGADEDAAVSIDLVFLPRGPHPVPEPGTFVLFGVAALGYGLYRRRRRAS